MFCRRATFVLLVSAVSTGLSVGCKWAPKAGRADPVAMEDYPQITVLEGLHRAVMISEVHQEKGPPLAVRVLVRNRTHDDERTIQYRFIFTDASGKRETAEPDWHVQHLPARTHVQISGNALDSRYTQWQLEIRPAH
jgi:hypothetical protein